MFFGLPALIVMAQLQSLLSAMHLPGETAYSLRDLAFPDRADAAIETWFAHSRETTQQFSGPGLVTLLFALVDTFVFVPAYTIVFSVGAATSLARLRAATDDDPLLPAYRTLTATAFLVVPLLVLVDVLENAATLLLVQQKGDAPGLLEWALTLFWVTKWVLALRVLVALLLAAIALARRAKAGGVDLWRTVVALRVQIVLVAFFAIFLFGPVAADQIDDVVRRWIGPDWEEVLASAALTLLLSLVIAATSWRLLLLQRRPGSDLPLRGTLARRHRADRSVRAARERRCRWARPAGLGAILVAIVALSYPIRNVRRVADPARATFGWAGAPAVLASLPLTLLGLAAVRAAVFELVYAQHLEYLGLIAIGLLLQALGWAVYFLAFGRGLRPRAKKAEEAPSIVPLYAAGVVVAFIAVGVWLDPWLAGNVLGTIGALGAFLLGIALVGYAALTLERRWLSPPVFLVVGIKRFPVLLIVLAWAIAAAALDPGGFHDVRTIDRPRGARPGDARRRVASLGRTSAAARRGPARARRGGRRRDPRRVLDGPCPRLRDRRRLRQLRLRPRRRSRRSRLGLRGERRLRRQPRARRVRRVGPRPRAGQLGRRAARRRLRRGDGRLDALRRPPERAGQARLRARPRRGARARVAASLGHAVTPRVGPVRDVPLRQPLAAALAERHERAGRLSRQHVGARRGRRGSRDGQGAPRPRLPVDGRVRGRVDAERRRLRAGSDARHRRPAVRGPRPPAVHFGAALREVPVGLARGACRAVRNRVCDVRRGRRLLRHVGGIAAAGFWSRLEPLVARQNAAARRPCVVPVLLQLDNHYKEPRNSGATGRPWESGVPLQTVRAARDARENGARQAAALLFSTEIAAGVSASAGGAPLVRYAHLFPRAHPGTSAPLGWTLSQASMDDLTNQLRERANANELGKIRRWFASDLTCARG